MAVIWGLKGHWPLGTGPAYLDSILLVGDQIDTSLHTGMGPFPQHILLQLVDIWNANGEVRDSSQALPSRADPTTTAHSPSNLPEKLSVARQRFFFRPLFLASGMSIGWLEGMSAGQRPRWAV